jgi:uncharacterized protein involved in type VI secretion and phage assembly
VKWELQGTYKPRDYCVQYRETDFNFASRLMQEEGIYYFFAAGAMLTYFFRRHRTLGRRLTDAWADES